MNRRGHAIVVGDGIVGLSSALALIQDGWTVTLLGRDPDGAGGTALGSAGLLAVQTVQPLALPSLWKQLPRLLLDRDAPIVLDIGYLPRALPWLARLLWASRRREVERLSVALAWLLQRSYAGYEALLGGDGARQLVRRDGLLTIYRTPEQVAGADLEIGLRRRRGIRLEVIEGAALRQAAPALSPDYKLAVAYPDCGHVPDIGSLANALLERFLAEGGQRVVDEAEGLEEADGRVAGVIGRGGRHRGDLVVVACGAWSRPLAARAGAAVPLDTERGYHVMLPDPGVTVATPMIVGDIRFAITPMTAGLRLAGTIEFAGLAAPHNPRRPALLLDGARRCLPGLRTDGAQSWMGFRPSLPDSLPVIGFAPRRRNVLLAFGHGHLGLTLGPATGALIRDLAAGRPVEEPLRSFRPDRFGRHAGGA
ncbi:MAG: FAD-binding oxidoreductase [Dongiaceae bacterium]